MTAPPLGRWLRAGTPSHLAYPCMCRGERACGMRCVCRGRRDAEVMPPGCCARKALDTKERNEGIK